MGKLRQQWGQSSDIAKVCNKSMDKKSGVFGVLAQGSFCWTMVLNVDSPLGPLSPPLLRDSFHSVYSFSLPEEPFLLKPSFSSSRDISGLHSHLFLLLKHTTQASPNHSASLCIWNQPPNPRKGRWPCLLQPCALGLLWVWAKCLAYPVPYSVRLFTCCGLSSIWLWISALQVLPLIFHL